MLFVKFLIALAPIIWLIIALSGIKMAGYKACGIALVIAAILGFAGWKESALDVGSAALEGALNALWPICLVIIAALFTYNLTLETGAMERIKSMLSGVSMDQRVLLLLIGWGFGNFMEGMAGFGTAVAIPAGILVALGMDPIQVVLACLVANSTPTAFGSVGVPTVTLSSVVNMDVSALSWNTAVIEALLMFLTPFFMVIILGKGVKALKGSIGLVLVAALSFTVPAVLTGMFLGPELPDIIGSICCMAAIILYAKAKGGRQVPQQFLAAKAEGQEEFSFGEGLRAWSPFILIFLFLLFTSSIFPAIHDPLSSIKTAVTIYTGEGASPLSFSWINTPGVLIFIAAMIGGIVQKASGKTMWKVFLHTVKSNWKTVFTICSVLATAKIMSHSGMTSDIAAFLVVAAGVYFPFISPLIGALGAFITGSGTSTCVLFGGMQAQTAAAIGVNPSWLASANTLGAGIGKMVCPQSIAIGAAAVEKTGSESLLLRKVFPWCLLYVILAGLLCFFLPGILF